MKILLVDDDPRLRALVALSFERAGFQVVTAADGQHALTCAAREAPDLVVLDVGLPELDGFEVFRRLRARSDLPVLFLTARDDEIDRVLGMELGADDYVTKPFSPRELVARVRAILKRVRPAPLAEVAAHGPVTLDRARHHAQVGEVVLDLTSTEFALLWHLVEVPGRVRSRQHLVAALWGPRSPVSGRTLDSHLRNLRRKLAEAGAGDCLETLHGVGVRLRE